MTRCRFGSGYGWSGKTYAAQRCTSGFVASEPATSAPTISALALAVLANEARRNTKKPVDRDGLGLLVQVFDQRKGFWRTGTLLRLGRKWAVVRTPARTFTVPKENVRPCPEAERIERGE